RRTRRRAEAAPSPTLSSPADLANPICPRRVSMPRRWPACLAALFAVFALAAQGMCKPPDLPRYQTITVTPKVADEDADPALLEALGFMSNYPIQVLDLGELSDGPCGEEFSECPVAGRS